MCVGKRFTLTPSAHATLPYDDLRKYIQYDETRDDKYNKTWLPKYLIVYLRRHKQHTHEKRRLHNDYIKYRRIIVLFYGSICKLVWISQIMVVYLRIILIINKGYDRRYESSDEFV